MLLRRLLFLVCASVLALPARSATVLVLQFHNTSDYSDLDWVGESIAETMIREFGAANQIVLDRSARAEAMRRLSLRSGADFTKATVIRLGQSLDVDYVCFGTYDVHLPTSDTPLKDSSLQIAAHLLDLRKLRDAPDLAEAGKISELSRLEEHLSWQFLKYLSPSANLPLDQFLAPQKLTRMDAEESYVRGLLSTNKDQQQKWFIQALALDSHFASPAFELGKLSLERKDYRQALRWFQHVPADDPTYAEARFDMGLGAYGAADFTAAANYFREVLKAFPLNEVYNDLAAAEFRQGLPSAIDDFRHALEGDANDPVYLFNLGVALLNHGDFDDAAKQFQAVLDRRPNDSPARTLLGQAQSHQPVAAGATPPSVRLKHNFDESAFRQLKAMLQPKGSG